MIHAHLTVYYWLCIAVSTVDEWFFFACVSERKQKKRDSSWKVTEDGWISTRVQINEYFVYVLMRIIRYGTNIYQNERSIYLKNLKCINMFKEKLK